MAHTRLGFSSPSKSMEACQLSRRSAEGIDHKLRLHKWVRKILERSTPCGLCVLTHWHRHHGSSVFRMTSPIFISLISPAQLRLMVGRLLLTLAWSPRFPQGLSYPGTVRPSRPAPRVILPQQSKSARRSTPCQCVLIG